MDAQPSLLENNIRLIVSEAVKGALPELLLHAGKVSANSVESQSKFADALAEAVSDAIMLALPSISADEWLQRLLNDIEKYDSAAMAKEIAELDIEDKRATKAFDRTDSVITRLLEERPGLLWSALLRALSNALAQVSVCGTRAR